LSKCLEQNREMYHVGDLIDTEFYRVDNLDNMVYWYLTSRKMTLVAIIQDLTDELNAFHFGTLRLVNRNNIISWHFKNTLAKIVIFYMHETDLLEYCKRWRGCQQKNWRRKTGIMTHATVYSKWQNITPSPYSVGHRKLPKYVFDSYQKYLELLLTKINWIRSERVYILSVCKK
jgi:hypothetical protein